jgi:hypothetical protein
MIDSESEIRFRVQIEMQAISDSSAIAPEEMFDDHLAELQSILAELEPDERTELCEQAYRVQHYDLCMECYHQFVRNPLSIEPVNKLEFSDN